MGTGEPTLKRRFLVRMLVITGTGLFLLTVLIVWRQGAYDGNVQRIADALPTRPPSPSPTASPVAGDPGKTWLLIGSDQRGRPDSEKWSYSEARSDVIMILHLLDNARRADIVSIPRDAWVEIPGHGHRKINSAFAIGGSRLLVETVEQLTDDLRIDHVAIIDFRGFREMTDALGGVEIELDEPIHDPSNGWSWPAGKIHLNGKEALRFVRERKGLPGSDVDRVKHQHLFLKAMAQKAADTDTLTNPFKLDAFLDAASRSLAIDESADASTLRGLAFHLADVGPDNVTFTSLPISSTAWIGRQNVAHLDESRTGELLKALHDDRLKRYLKQHGLSESIS